MDIQLTQGQFTTIDVVDADLAGLGWYAQKGHRTFYADRKLPSVDGKQKTERIHQVIARRMGIVGPPDHIDRDGLNNRRGNLRPDPDRHNSANQRRRSDNTSGYKGVSFREDKGRWRTQIKVGGKVFHLGYYTDEIEAAEAYDRAALAAFGEFALLNFPAAIIG